MTNSCEETVSHKENELLADAGFEPPFKCVQLKAGRNNQVFKVIDSCGVKVILKRYFHHEGDQRDRLEHEWRFLEYASRVAPQFVPRLLARSDDVRVALIEWVEGTEFDSPPSREEVLDAVAFVSALNTRGSGKPEPGFPVAADACFTQSDHLDLLRRRIDRLPQVEDPEAKEFVRKTLEPAARLMLSHSVETEKSSWDATDQDGIVSPSDFGYHNALRRGGQPTCFLDFEYAGWDGVGKMIADYFSQPRIRVDLECLPEFENMLSTCLSERGREEVENRLPELLAIHGLKWCCILLNDFLAVDRKRRKFSGSERRNSVQLQNAANYFEQVCAPRMDALSLRSSLG